MSLRMTRTSEFGTNRTCQPPRLMSAQGVCVLNFVWRGPSDYLSNPNVLLFRCWSLAWLVN